MFLCLSGTGAASAAGVLCACAKAPERRVNPGSWHTDCFDGRVAAQRLFAPGRELRVDNVRIHRRSRSLAGLNQAKNSDYDVDLPGRHDSAIPFCILENGNALER